MVDVDRSLRSTLRIKCRAAGKSHADTSDRDGLPVWTGIGAIGAVLVGIFVFREPATFWRVFFLTTLIASIVGLKTIS